MTAISYVIADGQTLEQVTTGTAAPTSGTVEIRIDTTNNAITDAGGTRAPKKGEIYALINILTQFLIRDTSIPQ